MQHASIPSCVLCVTAHLCSDCIYSLPTTVGVCLLRKMKSEWIPHRWDPVVLCGSAYHRFVDYGAEGEPASCSHPRGQTPALSFSAVCSFTLRYRVRVCVCVCSSSL